MIFRNNFRARSWPKTQNGVLRFSRTAKGYEGFVAKLLRRGGRLMLIYLVLALAVGWLYWRLPTAFLPQEDQGNILLNIQLPAGATQERTLAVMSEVEKYTSDLPSASIWMSSSFRIDWRSERSSESDMSSSRRSDER